MSWWWWLRQAPNWCLYCTYSWWAFATQLKKICAVVTWDDFPKDNDQDGMIMRILSFLGRWWRLVWLRAHSRIRMKFTSFWKKATFLWDSFCSARILKIGPWFMTSWHLPRNYVWFAHVGQRICDIYIYIYETTMWYMGFPLVLENLGDFHGKIRKVTLSRKLTKWSCCFYIWFLHKTGFTWNICRKYNLWKQVYLLFYPELFCRKDWAKWK